jgi:hypothetical protein
MAITKIEGNIMKYLKPAQRSPHGGPPGYPAPRPLAGAAALVIAALLAVPGPASATHRSFALARNWSTIPFYGTYGTFFGDVDGDGKADAIGVNDDHVWYRLSDGCYFGANQWLTNTPFRGELGTYFADVTGDGKVDPIANNGNGVIVRRSEDGKKVVWYRGGLSTNTTFADVNGDGKADAVESDGTSVYVMLSNGVDEFQGPRSWTFTLPPTYATRGVYFADVDGDKRADAIYVNDDSIIVRRSVKDRLLFGPEERWSDYPYYGQIMNTFVDMTGDRLADAVAVSYFGIAVRDSVRTAFRGLNANYEVTEGGTAIAKWGLWTRDGFYGSRQTSFADVDGDWDADAIAVNDDGVWIRKANYNHDLYGCS